jgi:DNA invertase Pin-like site-specific DNA recombinase
MNIGTLLTIEQIREIRKLLAQGVAPKTVAYQFGKHVNTIYNIIKKPNWEGV